MKKMWKNRKDAVSPVIATILMVAITVVLAAVLYVMVMGFGGNQSQTTPTITLTYQKSGSYSGGSNYTFTVAAVNRNDVKATDITVKLVPTAGTVTPTFSTNIQAGDTIVLHDLTPGTTYTLTLVYGPTNAAAYQMTWSAT
jgi:flagellin-like protein